ncbi:hypothetical protein JOM56_010680 [Amanita muscaria]
MRNADMAILKQDNMQSLAKKHPSECRLYASNFIRLLSVLTLQMCILCRGLKVLVDLLDEEYAEEGNW